MESCKDGYYNCTKKLFLMKKIKNQIAPEQEGDLDNQVKKFLKDWTSTLKKL